jgi:hypothetical protein
LHYYIGQQIRLIIPPTFGCRTLNNETGYILSITGTDQITVSIDSTNAEPFVASSATTKAQVIPVGDINSGRINASGRSSTATYIQGSYINISPN